MRARPIARPAPCIGRARGVPRACRGAARPLLLAVLGLSVATLGGGLYYLATSDAGHETDPDEGDEEFDVEDGGGDLPPSGAGDPDRRRRGTPRTGENGEEVDGEGDLFFGDRDPEGDVFVVDDASLRGVLAARHFEEIRRQIDVLQREGKVVPADVVQTLLDLLETDALRIDAMLALGQLTDDASGRLLAELAADAGTPEVVRIAALEALSKSGQAAGLTHVRQLVEAATEDNRLTRQALFAMAAMGGRDGVAPLLSFLAAHSDDPLTDAAVTALAKAKGADAVLAQEVRAARDGADAARLQLLLRVGNQTGAKAGDEFRAEVKRLVESPDALAAISESEETRTEVFATAIAVAASMGGDALDAVIRVARDQTGTFRGVALHALRQARGDAAAAGIASLLAPTLDERARRDVIVALGTTESRKATPHLHAALDDPDANVRHAAATGLGQVRDPASVPVILERLEGAKGDFTLAMQYVNALGTIGDKQALPQLEGLLGRDDTFWKSVEPYVRRAITRIDTGNPQATRIR